MLSWNSWKSCGRLASPSCTPEGRKPGVASWPLTRKITSPSVVFERSMSPLTAVTRSRSTCWILVGARSSVNDATAPSGTKPPSPERSGMRRISSIELRFTMGYCSRTSTKPFQVRTLVTAAPPTATRAAVAAAPGATPYSAAFAGSMRTVRCGAAFSAPVCTFTVPGSERMYAASLLAAPSSTLSGPESVYEIGAPLPPPPRSRHLHLRALAERRRDLAQLREQIVLFGAVVLEQRDAVARRSRRWSNRSPTACIPRSNGPCRRAVTAARRSRSGRSPLGSRTAACRWRTSA